MKNIEVDNDKIAHGFEEAAKVLDHYILSGWIVPCQKCGTWLTSLGLCPDGGVRFEIVELGVVNDALSLVEGLCACVRWPLKDVGKECPNCFQTIRPVNKKTE